MQGDDLPDQNWWYPQPEPKGKTKYDGLDYHSITEIFVTENNLFFFRFQVEEEVGKEIKGPLSQFRTDRFNTESEKKAVSPNLTAVAHWNPMYWSKIPARLGPTVALQYEHDQHN